MSNPIDDLSKIIKFLAQYPKIGGIILILMGFVFLLYPITAILTGLFLMILGSIIIGKSRSQKNAA